MSKTAQRRTTAQAEGRNDAIRGLPIRWKRHPNMRDYMYGYKIGKKVREKVMKRRREEKRAKVTP